MKESCKKFSSMKLLEESKQEFLKKSWIQFLIETLKKVPEGVPEGIRGVVLGGISKKIRERFLKGVPGRRL